MKKLLVLAALLFLGAPAYGQQVNLYCYVGTPTFNPWAPCSSSNWPGGGGSGNPTTVKIDQTTPGTTNGVQINAALPAGTNVVGYTSNDPCTQAAKTNLAISFQTTSIAQIIALSGTTKIYVCSLSLISSVATVFSITGGTGSNCGTPAALIGTTSATHGLSLAANGGLTLGNGAGTVAVTAAGSELCIVQSGAGDISGNLTYVQQ